MYIYIYIYIYKYATWMHKKWGWAHIVVPLQFQRAQDDDVAKRKT